MWCIPFCYIKIFERQKAVLGSFYQNQVAETSKVNSTTPTETAREIRFMVMYFFCAKFREKYRARI